MPTHPATPKPVAAMNLTLLYITALQMVTGFLAGPDVPGGIRIAGIPSYYAPLLQLVREKQDSSTRRRYGSFP
jgi:hypothetical protein